MATFLAPAAPQHIVLNVPNYQVYVTINDLIGRRPVRVTYDRGSLEIRTLCREHELSRSLLGTFVVVVAEETATDLAFGGSLTFRQEDLDRGLEADECYWIEHEAQMRGKDTYDPNVDPPPDLGLEVEVSRSALDRMGIYAALRVPEVWRFDGQTLHIHLLSRSGKYVERKRSKAFPFLPVAELVRFLNLRTTMSNTALVRAFRTWVRERITTGWTPPT